MWNVSWSVRVSSRRVSSRRVSSRRVSSSWVYTSRICSSRVCSWGSMMSIWSWMNVRWCSSCQHWSCYGDVLLDKDWTINCFGMRELANLPRMWSILYSPCFSTTWVWTTGTFTGYGCGTAYGRSTTYKGYSISVNFDWPIYSVLCEYFITWNMFLDNLCNWVWLEKEKAELFSSKCFQFAKNDSSICNLLVALELDDQHERGMAVIDTMRIWKWFS